jgi:hypothetical protein
MRGRPSAAAASAAVLCCGLVVTPPARAGQAPGNPPRPAPRPAVAVRDTWPVRGFLNLSAGLQGSTRRFSEAHSEPISAEDFTWTSDYRIKDGLALEGGGGVRLWHRLFAGATYSRFHDSRAAAIEGATPHPFFFNQPRRISGETPALTHDEQAVHVSAIWMVPAGRHVELAISGGPSLINVNREFVADVGYSEEYPFDTATFTSATVKAASKTAVGGHAGLDLTWLFTRQVGVGAVVRYSRATVEFATPAGSSLPVDAGGLQAMAGIRVRFLSRAARRPPPRTPPAPAKPPAPTMPPVVGTFPTATTTARAPLFLRPDAARTPLVQLPPGTRLRVLEEVGEWLRVEYQDSQYGRRVGYIQRMFVRIEGTPR